ncbi:tryptophan biosynthesis modulator TrpM [Streptomyces sp. NPDC060194]|uniref:tryptophan biosynthesis modulator TrpM n=1 Tax=Streptomyces sp. NPDC060194 TaxID=3347069 RepID=UPI0036608A52
MRRDARRRREATRSVVDRRQRRRSACQASRPRARSAGQVLAPGCRPRGCRAPARRVHGRRVRYVIGSEPGQVNGMRWRRLRAARSRQGASARR